MLKTFLIVLIWIFPIYSHDKILKALNHLNQSKEFSINPISFNDIYSFYTPKSINDFSSGNIFKGKKVKSVRFEAYRQNCPITIEYEFFTNPLVLNTYIKLGLATVVSVGTLSGNFSIYNLSPPQDIDFLYEQNGTEIEESNLTVYLNDKEVLESLKYKNGYLYPVSNKQLKQKKVSFQKAIKEINSK